MKRSHEFTYDRQFYKTKSNRNTIECSPCFHGLRNRLGLIHGFTLSKYKHADEIRLYKITL